MPSGARQSTSQAEGPDLRAIARRRSLAAAAVAVLLGAALLFDLPSQLASMPAQAPGNPGKPAAIATAPTTAAAQPSVLLPGNSGCLEPVRWSVDQNTALERADTASNGWTPSPAAGHLEVDPCGTVWALWFNSWTVVRPGEPDRVATLQPLRSGATAELVRQGVASFTFDAQRALWVLGRDGEVVRHPAARPWKYGPAGEVVVTGQPDWEALPALQGCREGELQRWRQEIWVACPFVPRYDAAGRIQAAQTSVLRWNESGRRWDGIGGAPTGARRIVIDARERLWVAAPGVLARRDAGRGEGWVAVAGEHGAPTALAALPEGFAVGTEAGLWLFDGEGQSLSAELPGVHVVGLAAEGARLWVATWRQGLYLRENGAWYRWQYAQGLPDDLVRDVLADGRGRLWLGSSPGGWMPPGAAAAQIKRLPSPVELPGQHYADACAAASELLGGEGVSGDVASARFEDRHLVFLGGRQACPAVPGKQGPGPVFWRREDGALLELAYNGRGGSSFSDGAQMAGHWQVRLHQPLAGGGWHSETLPLPEPLPPETPGALAQLDAQNQVWIATGQSGIWQFDGRRWRQHAGDAGYGSQNRPQAMLADGEGLLWVGSSPDWLFAEKRQAGPALQRWQDERWQPLAPGEHTLSVFALAAGAGLRWIGDNGKLWRLGPEGIAGLEDEVLRGRGLITHIVIDESGQPWLTHGSTSEGLSHHDGGRTRILTSREGLFTDDIALLGFDAEQRLWLLAEDGRVAVYPREVLLAALR